ncbi:MAG: helix-turn-helix domain-containing protein [Desulfurococcales archaeon]|jgi:hypothetical protein|nr:helix-turn-helix domain-containing protein [Desulfurococcales archaeon]
MARKVVDALIAINKFDCPLMIALTSIDLNPRFYNINVSESKVTHILAIEGGDVKRLTRIAGRLGLKVRYIDTRGGIIWIENYAPCSFCRILSSLGGVPLSLDLNDKKVPLYRILLPSRRSFLAMREKLEASGLEPQLLRAGYRLRVARLTPMQMRALVIAYENGFFDFPKRVNLEALSKMLGVKPSTLDEILRRGLRKLVEEYIAREEPIRL